MPNIIASEVLANGLRTEFTETYLGVMNRQSDGRLGQVMDLDIGATNRYHDFAYFEAGPHITLWRRGEPVPGDAMGSVHFRAVVYDWARRVKWHKHDRADDQTQSLMEAARMAGQSAGLLAERMFFDLIGGTTNTLPAVPNAPDGVAMFYATDAAGGNRFGVSGGNLLSTSGVTTVHDVQADYWTAIERAKQFQDGKGQPLFSDDVTDGPTLVLHAAADTEIMEQSFIQMRHAMGIDQAGARGGTVLAAAAETNLVMDTSRRPTLWGSSRIATGTWYVFLLNAPKKPTFRLVRQSVQEFEALEGSNNSDHTRDTGEEYVQWECREGAGIALPYACFKIT